MKCGGKLTSNPMKRNKGWDKTPEQKRKISQTLKRIGHKGKILWKNGHPCYFVAKHEKNWAWKDNKVGYFALRMWLTREYGKPNKCVNPDCVYPRRNYDGELMLSPKRYEWIPVSGSRKENRRERKHWITLCPSCRNQYYLGQLSISPKQ